MQFGRTASCIGCGSMNPVAGGIVCIGSLHYDILVNTVRLPRLGETIAAEGWVPRAGGKGGNQATAAARAGSSVTMVGAVGKDVLGEFLLTHLKVAGVCTKHVIELDGATGMSVAIKESGGEYGAVIASGVNQDIPMGVATTPSLWETTRLLMLQNEIPDALNTAAAVAANEHGIAVCLNAAPYRHLQDTLTKNVDILVVNALEASELSGLDVKTSVDAREAARALLDKFKTIIVTVGDQGACVASRKAGEFRIPAERIVGNAHGAGDVFIGTMCAELVVGAGLEDATTCASKCASRHVAENI